VGAKTRPGRWEGVPPEQGTARVEVDRKPFGWSAAGGNARAIACYSARALRGEREGAARLERFRSCTRSSEELPRNARVGRPQQSLHARMCVCMHACSHACTHAASEAERFAHVRSHALSHRPVPTARRGRPREEGVPARRAPPGSRHTSSSSLKTADPTSSSPPSPEPASAGTRRAALPPAQPTASTYGSPGPTASRQGAAAAAVRAAALPLSRPSKRTRRRRVSIVKGRPCSITLSLPLALCQVTQ
jgi:hypothetical protein